MWQVDAYLVVNMSTLVQLLLSFSYFKSLFSFTKLYCVSFRFVCFVLFRFVSFRLFSLKWHFRETRNFAKMLFIFTKLRNSIRFRFAKISRNEIPLKTLAGRGAAVWECIHICLSSPSGNCAEEALLIYMRLSHV
jgi:hypothetical protein